MPSGDAHRILADLADDDEQRKAEAIRTIVQFTPDADVDEAAFIAALNSPNVHVVHWAAMAIKLLGPRDPQAIPALLALLGREQLFIRQAAVRALAAVGPYDRLARAAVFDLFGDESPFIRREAMAASLTLPDLDEENLAAIAAMATDSDPEVADMALRSIRSEGETRTDDSL